MKKTRKTKIYTIYLLNKVNNDLQYISEYLNIEQLKKDYNIKNYNYNDYIAKYDEKNDVYKSRYILQDKYIILKEEL
jgi:hypothetical protein